MKRVTGHKDVNAKEIHDGDKVRVTVPDRPYIIEGNGWMDADVEKGYTFEGIVEFDENSGEWFVIHEEYSQPVNMEKETITEILERD